MIRVPSVRVVDEEGSQLGVMPTFEALRLAQERGYDLVEVAPLAVPPVVRLLDYGQYKYEAAKKEKEARRHQRSVDFKEIRIKPKIGSGDFDTKVRRAVQFLDSGDRVKVACQFRGRELTHAYLGRDLLLKFADLVKDHGALERQPLLEGKSMSIVIASTHRPKVQPAPPPKEEAQVGGAEAAPAPKPAPAAAEEPAPKPAAPKPAAPKPAPAAAEEPAVTPAVAPAAAEEPVVAQEPAPSAAPVAEPAPPTAPKPRAPRRTSKATAATRIEPPAEAPAASPARAGE
jgi:translation initiation factor IF-3